MGCALKAEELSVSFDRKSILWEISLEIPKGSLVGIIGPNGAGKSTLLKAAIGLIPPFSGRISLFGSSAYVPQRESIDWDFPISAEELVLMGRYKNLGFWGRVKDADIAAAGWALEQVGLSSLAKRQIGELSGGQQQRLFIARALVQNPDIYLLDEPFAGIDLASERAIMEILRKERKLGKTILIVHHDLPSVESYFDWVVLLNRHLHGVGEVKSVFTKEKLAKVFNSSSALFDEALELDVKRRQGRA